MTRETIIKEFTDNIEAFEKLAYNIAGEDDAEDLFQECTLMLLEFPEDRLISYHNPTQGLKPFFIRMLMNQYRSETSKFHKNYRKQESDLRNKMEDIILNEPQSEYGPSSNFMELANKACDNIYLSNENKLAADIENMVWTLFVETGSLRKTLTAIPEEYADLFDLKTVHVIVKKFRRTIKEKLSLEV
ncbi:MAG: hypothetical protein ABJB11_00330 [Ferruginibacter sp.]